jgi:thymidylate kinase
MQGKYIVIDGPDGAGKTSIVTSSLAPKGAELPVS